MSETLGSLIDKLSITMLKEYHCTDERIASLREQKARLISEIDDLFSSAVQDPSSVILTNPANKIVS
jgi:hypothetical protein